MDALALLTADHNRVRGLFSRFEKAKDAEATDEMGSLATEIITELTVHTTIEEQQFYPWAEAISDEIKEMVAEGVEEHHVVKVLIDEIKALQPGQEAWTAKMTVLIENVEHHAKEEEEDLFPKVRSGSDSKAREAMGEELEQAKKELGAPVLADKIDLTLDDLKGLASDQEIPGRSSMDRDELAATVAPPTS